MTGLAIYVAGECQWCDKARQLATEVREEFPDVKVSVIDLDSEEAQARIFTTPAYLLDGRVTFVGNPRREDLWERLNNERQQPQATKD